MYIIPPNTNDALWVIKAYLRPLEQEYRSKNNNSLEIQLKLTCFGKNKTLTLLWVIRHKYDLEIQSVSFTSLKSGLKLAFLVTLFIQLASELSEMEKNFVEFFMKIFTIKFQYEFEKRMSGKTEKASSKKGAQYHSSLMCWHVTPLSVQLKLRLLQPLKAKLLRKILENSIQTTRFDTDIHLQLSTPSVKMSKAPAAKGSELPKNSKISGSERSKSNNRAGLENANHSDKTPRRHSVSEYIEKSKGARNRDERRSKEHAKKMAEAENAAKSTPSTITGKRKNEVLSPTGLTPENKAKNTGTCTFSNFLRLKLSPSQLFCDKFFEFGHYCRAYVLESHFIKL